jgi:hypothetical protein
MALRGGAVKRAVNGNNLPNHYISKRQSSCKLVDPTALPTLITTLQAIVNYLNTNAYFYNTLTAANAVVNLNNANYLNDNGAALACCCVGDYSNSNIKAAALLNYLDGLVGPITVSNDNHVNLLNSDINSYLDDCLNNVGVTVGR